MDDLQFQENTDLVPQQLSVAGQSGFIGLVIKWGLAQDAKGAERILLIVAVSLIVLALLAYIFISPSVGTPQAPSSASWPHAGR